MRDHPAEIESVEIDGVEPLSLQPERPWSLRDMLGLNAGKFLDTVKEITRVKTIIEKMFDDDNLKAVPTDHGNVRQQLAHSFF